MFVSQVVVDEERPKKGALDPRGRERKRTERRESDESGR